MSDQIERVGVIGAGQMGAGIAEVSARAGVDVIVYEPTAGLYPNERHRFLNLLSDISDDVIIIPAVSDGEARDRFPEGWKTLKPYLRVVPQPA